MFATTPSGYSKQAVPLFSSKAPLATSLGALFPDKGYQGSPASTRSASPGSSSSSSEEVVGPASPKEQFIDSGDRSVLACRRGRSVLMLNELVIDLEVLPCRGGSSDGSPSSVETVSGNVARCTPCTQQMMSFSPQVPQSSPMIIPLANQVAKHSMMRTTPMMRSIDASQRSPACAQGRGAALGLGAAAAGGDASHRNPIAKVSLGVAVIGGDASQRSPPGCMNLSQIRPVVSPMQQSYAGSSPVDLGMPLSPMDTSLRTPSNGTITGTCPGSQASPTKRDASQRSPAGCVPTNPTIENCNDAVKAWLLGVNGVSAVDLAEKLYAAAPEIYED